MFQKILLIFLDGFNDAWRNNFDGDAYLFSYRRAFTEWRGYEFLDFAEAAILGLPGRLPLISACRLYGPICRDDAPDGWLLKERRCPLRDFFSLAPLER